MDIMATVAGVSPETDYGRPVDEVTVTHEGTSSTWHTDRGKYTVGQQVPAEVHPTPGGAFLEITPVT